MKKRRTKVPVGGWFVNYNAGDVEHNNQVFNAANNASESPSTNPTGPMGEGLEESGCKWNIGSDKRLQSGSEEYKKMQQLADALNAEVKDGLTHFEVEDCYEDYGAGIMWTTIICYYPDKYSKQGMSSYQILDPKQWLDYMNGSISVEELANQVDDEQGHRWKGEVEGSISEAFEDDYTEEEIIDCLVDITKNFTVQRPLEVWSDHEKDIIVKELKKHYNNVELSCGERGEGDQIPWIITYNNTVKECNLTESEDKVVDTLYDITTIEKGNAINPSNEEHYGTYLSYDQACSAYDILEYKGEYEAVILLRIDITESGKYLYTELKSTKNN